MESKKVNNDCNSESSSEGAYAPCWINIKTLKPEKGQNVLISDGFIITAAECGYSPNGEAFWNGCEFGGWEWEWNFDDRLITHWMPLPKLPEGA